MLIPFTVGAYNRSAPRTNPDERSEVRIPYRNPYLITEDIINNKNRYLYSLSYALNKYIGKEIIMIKKTFSINHELLNALTDDFEFKLTIIQATKINIKKQKSNTQDSKLT
jgi:hypothetical protein